MTSFLYRSVLLGFPGILVSFMNYDLGFFDSESGRVECAPNPFDAKVSPMCPV
jgi:hypothetical protein